MGYQKLHALNERGLTVLGGGRLRIDKTNDILLWSSANGSRRTNWSKYSISYWHNKLVVAQNLRFTQEVNSTSEPRETSSYVSLLGTGPSGFVIVYDKRGPPDTVFAMRVDWVV